MADSFLEDDEHCEPSPWSDASDFGPRAQPERGFWFGTGDRDEEGPLRGWWIRQLYHAARVHTPGGDVALWERMTQWLVEARPDDGYLSFRTDETFRPGSIAGGYWVVLPAELDRDLPRAFAWASAALGASQSLEGVLAAPGAFVRVAPREPSGAELLARGTDSAAVARFRKGRRCRDRWPRPCASCHQEFRPERRGIIRCEECRGAKRIVGADARREK